MPDTPNQSEVSSPETRSGSNFKLHWMHLYTRFFDKHEIKLLWKSNHEYVLLYLRLILESIPNHGILKYNASVCYTNEDIALLFDMDPSIVSSGMEMLKSKRLIDIKCDGTIEIPYAVKCSDGETEWAGKKRNQRRNERLENGWRRLNDKLMVSKDGKRKISVDETEFGGHGMSAMAKVDGKCSKCGSSRNLVILGGEGEMTDSSNLKVLCHKCAAEELEENTVCAKGRYLAARALKTPPSSFQEVLDYLSNDEKFMIVNPLALEAKFNELQNRGWRDGNGRIIRDWRKFFMGMAARHLTKAVAQANAELAQDSHKNVA